MEESKRQALHDRMNYLFNNEEEKIKEKKRRELQTQHEEESLQKDGDFKETIRSKMSTSI